MDFTHYPSANMNTQPIAQQSKQKSLSPSSWSTNLHLKNFLLSSFASEKRKQANGRTQPCQRSTPTAKAGMKIAWSAAIFA